jgi:Coenzyme PQQ synthesis protein D (PqqD)
MPPLKPKARDDLTVVEVDGEAVIFDPVDGRLHHLNPAATLVLKICDGSGTIGELADDIADVMGLPGQQTLRQVRRVIKQFKQARLLDGVEPPRAPQGHTHTHSHDHARTEAHTNG